MVCTLPSSSDDAKLQEHRWPIAPRRLVRNPTRRGGRVVPAVAQHGADRVLALLQSVGHVVGDVQRSLVVAGEGRIEHVIADLAAVEMQFVEAQAAHADGGRADRLLDLERLAKHGARGRLRPLDVEGQFLGVRDPFRLPLGRIENAHRPKGRLAPIGRLAVLVPHADLPPALRVRRQRLAGILDLNRPIGLDSAGVPEIALVLLEQFGAAGHENLIGRLPLAALVGSHEPIQPRLGHVDAQGVFEIFATQAIDLRRCGIGREPRC